MNYGDLLETLKNSGPNQTVRLRGAGVLLLIDLVMADESGVYLVNEPERSPGCLDAADLLTALRAIENQPEFSDPVFADTPGGTEPLIAVYQEGDSVIFEAAGVIGSDKPAAVVIQHDFAGDGLACSMPGCDEPADAEIHNMAAPSRHLSPPAAGVLNAMGFGMLLRVPHDGSAAMLDDGTDYDRESIGPMTPELVQELVASGHITKLTKDRTNNRLGWAEKGLDGDKADFYCCTQ